MAACDYCSECLFFNGKLENRPDSEELKDKYCNKNNLNCAIYMIVNAVSKDKVPSDLYPNEKEKAYLTIVENS